MKNIAILLDYTPSDGGTYQYNVAILNSFLKIEDQFMNKIVLYTNLHWHDALKDIKIEKQFVLITNFRKKLLKLITLLNLNQKFRSILLQLLFPKLNNQLNKGNFELIILPSQDIISLFVLKPKLNAIHDLMHRYEHDFPEVSKPFQKNMRDLLYKSFCDESAAILVDSQVGKDQVVESYNANEDNIFILPFIPPSYFFEEIIESDIRSIKTDWPIKYLFYPAQFWKHKNHDRLFQAVAKLKIQGINVKIVVTGDKKYEYNNLLLRAKDLDIEDNIVFSGFISENFIKSAYKLSNGLIMPTFFGPTNIPPLEAVFSGCPVAVSNIYGMPEQMKNAALYFDPNSVNEISNAIIYLWNDSDKNKELIENGKKLTFEWNQKKFNDQFKNVLLELLSRLEKNN